MMYRVSVLYATLAIVLILFAPRTFANSISITEITLDAPTGNFVGGGNLLGVVTGAAEVWEDILPLSYNLDIVSAKSRN